MPNLVTHTLFARDLMDKRHDPDMDAHKHLVEVGSNGPDIFFFDNIGQPNFPSQSHVRVLGSMIHDERSNDLFQKMLSVVKSEQNPEEREAMAAYVKGQLMHWALDGTSHPYIYWRTGNRRRRDMWNHHHLESLIDAAMLRLKLKTDISKFDVPNEIAYATWPETRTISKVWTPVLQDLYDPQVRPYMIADSLAGWHAAQNMMRDPNGLKAAALWPMENAAGLKRILTGYAIPAKFDDNWDLFNLLHKPWQNPQTGLEQTDGFLSLYQKALDQADQAIDLFDQALNGADQEEHDFLGFINDRNYCTGQSGPAQVYYTNPESFD